MNGTKAEQVDMALRQHVKSLCAPIWWESSRQTVVNSGTMCVVQTSEALLGITNNHVLKIYERHKAEKHDLFCQLGSAPFEPTDNVIARSEHWDLATFSIPEQTQQHWGHTAFVAHTWPPPPLAADDHVVFGGYPEVRRSVPPGPHPPTMSIDFVSFRRQPHNCSPEQVSFHIDPTQVTWLPNVHDPLTAGTSLSGMSGGPCFRIVAAEDRIELAGFIYEGDYNLGIVFARQARLVSAQGQIASAPF
jgi:hypothetical protein